MIRDIFIVSIFSFWISCGVVAQGLQHHDFFHNNFLGKVVEDKKQSAASKQVAGVQILQDSTSSIFDIPQTSDLFFDQIIHSQLFDLMRYVAQSMNDHYLLVQLQIMKNHTGVLSHSNVSSFLIAWVSSVDAFIKDVKIALMVHHIDLGDVVADDVHDDTVIKLIRDCRRVIHRLVGVIKTSKDAALLKKHLNQLFHKISCVKADLHIVTDSADTYVYIQMLLSSIHFVIEQFYTIVQSTPAEYHAQIYDQMILMVMRFQSYVDGVALL